jgi:hypothetical protein
MAKKDASLSLEYILQKQQSEKLSGLSSTVKSQLGNMPPAGSSLPSENNILSELKKINTSLNIGLNKNIVKMTNAIENSTSLLAGFIKGSRKQTPPQTKNDLSQQDIEDKDYKSKELKLLEEIRDGLKIKGKTKKETEFPWLTALSIAVVAAVAALRAWATLVKDIIVALTPSKLRALFSQSFDKWVKGLFKDLKLSGRQIADFFKPVSNVFKSIAESKWIKGLVKDFNLAGKQVSSFFEVFKGTFSYISKAFGNAYKVVKTFIKVETFMSMFSGISKVFESLGKIGGVFIKSARAFGRIFKPIGIIFAIFDTITGAIEGYAKEGIKGAIAGAIKGLIGDFFFGFFDLVKGGISWVLDKIGLKSVSEALDSFSFVDMFKDFVDMVFHPIDTVKKLIENVSNWLSKIEIPGINFSMFGKKFEAGPWKPFSNLASNETPKAEPPSVMAPAIEVKPEQVVTPPAYQANAIYEQSAQNEEASMQQFAAPTNNIVSAPTNITRQTQNNLMKVNIRNQESTIKNYYRSRFST